MKKVHLVFDVEDIQSLAKALNGSVEITGTDFTMDTAAQWAMSGKGDFPDIILIDGTVEVSKVDLQSGKITRDQIFISRLREIRISRPESQVILLLPPERKNDALFLQAITTLVIFDIYFIETFSQDDLLHWFNKKKTIADVKNWLPGSDIQDTELSLQKSSFDKENQEEPQQKSNLFGWVGGLTSRKEEFKPKPAPETKPNPSSLRPVRYRSGQPAVVLGFGSKNLTDWFNTTFSNLVDIVGAATSPDEFQKAVHEKRPDLVVIMRIGPMGGLPEADALAEWATEHVPAVLFIAGELDENAEQMAERVKSAGGYVLSCPHGETINGDELVVLVQYIVRELIFVKVEQQPQPDAEERPRQPSINLEALKKGAIQLTSILKQGADKPDKSPGLLTRLKSQLEEGLSLEESAPVEMLANNVKNPTAIVAGGAFAVVSPWRPGLAGRIAAAAAKMFSEGGEEVAVIGASGYSTAAVWLDITDEELMMSDWRVPGSQAPVVKDNIKIWAVDPTKSLHMNIDGNLWVQLKEVRKTAAYTVIDFAGDFELAQKVAFQGRSVVLVIIPGGDPVEQRTALLWLNRFMEGKNNIIAGIDLRGVPPTTLQDFKPKLVIRNSPVDAFKMALCKNLDEFIWK